MSILCSWVAEGSVNEAWTSAVASVCDLVRVTWSKAQAHLQKTRLVLSRVLTLLWLLQPALQ